MRFQTQALDNSVEQIFRSNFHASVVEISELYRKKAIIRLSLTFRIPTWWNGLQACEESISAVDRPDIFHRIINAILRFGVRNDLIKLAVPW
jgi:hypothetical protein